MLAAKEKECPDRKGVFKIKTASQGGLTERSPKPHVGCQKENGGRVLKFLLKSNERVCLRVGEGARLCAVHQVTKIKSGKSHKRGRTRCSN